MTQSQIIAIALYSLWFVFDVFCLLFGKFWSQNYMVEQFESVRSCLSYNTFLCQDTTPKYGGFYLKEMLHPASSLNNGSRASSASFRSLSPPLRLVPLSPRILNGFLFLAMKQWRASKSIPGVYIWWYSNNIEATLVPINASQCFMLSD